MKHYVMHDRGCVIINPNVPIDTYDGTINSFPNSHPKIKFTKKNIGGTNTEKTTNLHSLIEPKNNIFLKMDIEGGEYDWLHSLSKKQLNEFQQIVIEFHKPFSADRYKTLEKISRYTQFDSYTRE